MRFGGFPHAHLVFIVLPLESIREVVLVDDEGIAPNWLVLLVDHGF